VRRQAKRERTADAATDPLAIREAALGLLARRDHAARELERKLQERGFDRQAVGAVLQELADEHLLDDERYVEHFVAYHITRGQGPARIGAELRQLQLPADIINRHLDAVADWREHARVVRRKKFGATIPSNYSARARQARFLQYRGFATDHIRAALEGDVAAEE
jgi:regulatory protein